eukprot:COSAG05_NODE_13976_length_412_cov_0.827476_1_plen_28_part_10
MRIYAPFGEARRACDVRLFAVQCEMFDS